MLEKESGSTPGLIDCLLCIITVLLGVCGYFVGRFISRVESAIDTLYEMVRNITIAQHEQGKDIESLKNRGP
jgi:hypothetical protein